MVTISVIQDIFMQMNVNEKRWISRRQMFTSFKFYLMQSYWDRYEHTQINKYGQTEIDFILVFFIYLEVYMIDMKILR